MLIVNSPLDALLAAKMNANPIEKWGDRKWKGTDNNNSNKKILSNRMNSIFRLGNVEMNVWKCVFRCWSLRMLTKWMWRVRHLTSAHRQDEINNFTREDKKKVNPRLSWQILNHPKIWRWNHCLRFRLNARFCYSNSTYFMNGKIPMKHLNCTF